MAIKRAHWPAGRIVTLEHVSSVLADNPLGDPHVRTLDVWLPPQYEAPRGRHRRFPVLFDLVGFTGSGKSHTNWRSFEENVPERAARLVYERKMAPAILVFPDCFTSLGGNQYINSGAIGRYADYLTRELIPFVDREFRTRASREHRACFGKSSGGYGALIHGMKYARYWGAIASHSGDAYFDFIYRCDWPNTLDALAKYRPKRPRTPRGKRNEGIDDGRVKHFLEHMAQNEHPTSAEMHCLMNLAMAASYDPDPKAPNGFRLPFDLETGEIFAARWRAWLRHDPIHLVRRHAANLRRLRGIFIDCGSRDQYRIHFGSRILARELAALKIAHRYEEFDGTHSGVDHRMERSLPFLTRALA